MLLTYVYAALNNYFNNMFVVTSHHLGIWGPQGLPRNRFWLEKVCMGNIFLGIQRSNEYKRQQEKTTTMIRENLKVSWGFGKGVNLTNYIRIMTWTGMIISSAMFVLTLSILVLPYPSAIHMSVRELVENISHKLALVILPIGSEKDSNDPNPVVFTDIVITMMLPSVGWFFYNLYLRKVNINSENWMGVEDFLKKSITVLTFFFNVLNLVSIAVTESLNIDWLDNKVLTSSSNVTSIVWITLSFINAIFSSTLLFGT